MAAIAGKGGQVRVGANVVADVQEWSLDIEKDILDDTALGDDWRSGIAGLKAGSGSLSMSFNYGDTNGQAAIHDSFFNDVEVSLSLDTADSGSNRTYSGSFWVTKLGPAVKVDDRVTQDVEIQANGAVAFA